MNMKDAKLTGVVGLAAMALLAGSPVFASDGVSERNITPRAFEGNFDASDDDQVCYELSELGYIDEVTYEMRGYKIDPPVDYDDGFVSATLSGKGRSLEWEALNATVLAFIIKGGPNFHVYDYVGTGFDWDKGLHSPVHKRNVPAISHYNVCYEPDLPGFDYNGCTPGYWRNHADRWSGVLPSDIFNTTFGVTQAQTGYSSDTFTLGDAIWAGGGGIDALARHATAALLNAWGGVPNSDGGTVAYKYTTVQVIAMVQNALSATPVLEGFLEDCPLTDVVECTKDAFAAANEAGCPLSGTKAKKVD